MHKQAEGLSIPASCGCRMRPENTKTSTHPSPTRSRHGGARARFFDKRVNRCLLDGSASLSYGREPHGLTSVSQRQRNPESISGISVLGGFQLRSILESRQSIVGSQELGLRVWLVAKYCVSGYPGEDLREPRRPERLSEPEARTTLLLPERRLA